MQRTGFVLLAALTLAACDNFTPNPKVASYDTQTHDLAMPYPCPDWSQTQVQNYKNEIHSNFGCAVNTNLAVQVENPEDLHHGHGDTSPDAEVTTRVIQQYRAGEIPVALTPIQTVAGTSQ